VTSSVHQPNPHHIRPIFPSTTATPATWPLVRWALRS
jgi:hypothetical protein